MKVGAPGLFGAQIKALREAAGFTHEELATSAGLSVHAVSALDRGDRRRPHVETVRALSAALDLTGPARDAYRAVREIPVTIAQMPCYCYCDRGMGHKSLYSCFEDDHAAHCAVCVDEALLTLKLAKEEKLTAPQIRERINQSFGHPGD